MQQFNFVIVKLTICLILGILISSYFNFSAYSFFIICLILVFLLGLVFFINKKKPKKDLIYGLLTFITFIFIGIATTTFQNHKNHLQHYTKHFNKDLNHNTSIVFKVKSILKPNNYYNKYVIQLKSIDAKSVTGKSLLNVAKDSTKTPLKVDDVLFTKTRIQELAPPLNPYQFDYKEYLKKQQIYHQLFVNNNELFLSNQERNTVFGFAARLREIINLKLKKYHFKPDELSIINALLLGQRQDISKEIYNNYTQAGAIHILAVSGLHVGIILLLLNFVLKPLEKLKQGVFFKTLLIVIFLWCFAIIAGLSASVTRAVTMFSIVAIGMNLKRPTNIFNTLAISIFILLLFKPSFLFDVGFQLSYLAVISIVWIQPLIYQLYKPKLLLINKFWQVFTVTISAQLGVFPISLFYFHQFPSLFFISNLVIVPVLGFILGFGIFIIILALINCLPQFLASSFGEIINKMNYFVTFISNQEAFLFKHVSFGILLVISSYLLIVTFVLLYKKITYNRLIYSLASIAIFFSVLVYYNYKNASNEFLVFHKNKNSLIGLKHNRNLIVHHDLNNLAFLEDKIITNYTVANWVKHFETDSIKSVYKINTELMLVVDSLGAYKTSFRPDYVLLRNSPKINLERLINHIHPKLIIADGSNYKSYQERWRETCLKKELPFYQTSKKGAFSIKY